MKSKLVTVYTIFIFLFGINAWSGHEGRGGDGEKMLFFTIIQKVFEVVKTNSSAFPEVDLKTFSDALVTTNITFVATPLILNGEEVAAINYPDKGEIDVNRLQWRLMVTTPTERFALTFHEFLSIMKVADNNYQVSSKLFKFLSPDIVKTIWNVSCQGYCGYIAKDPDLGKSVVIGNYVVIGEGMTKAEAFNEMRMQCELTIPMEQSANIFLFKEYNFFRGYAPPDNAIGMYRQAVMQDVCTDN